MTEKPNDLFQSAAITETLADQFVFPSAFRRLRLAPVLATGLILDLLQQHYGDPQAIIDPLLQHAIWRSGDSTSIIIETCHNDSLTRIGQMPAILVRRNRQRVIPSGIDNELKSLGPEIHSEYVVTIQGSHTVFCLAPRPGHAESLANETFVWLLQASHLIAGHLNMRKNFQMESLDELFQIEGSGGLYGVPMTLSYETWFEWSVYPTAPVLRQISLPNYYGLRPEELTSSK
jgi:hypothetical protein